MVRNMNEEVYGLLLDLVSAIRKEDESVIADCLVRVDQIEERIAFIEAWGKERKKVGYPA